MNQRPGGVAKIELSPSFAANGGGSRQQQLLQQQQPLSVQQPLQQHLSLQQEQLKFTTVDGRGCSSAAVDGVGAITSTAEVDLDFNILANYLAEEMQHGERL